MLLRCQAGRRKAEYDYEHEHEEKNGIFALFREASTDSW
jgi:hypothetical protein